VVIKADREVILDKAVHVMDVAKAAGTRATVPGNGKRIYDFYGRC
jgi:hypothetical protein